MCVVIATAACLGVAVSNYYYLDYVQNKRYFWVLLSILIICVMTGKGLVYTNILQLGIDQLLNTSFHLLHSLVCWYYWSLFIGPLFIYYVLVVFFVLGKFHDRTYKGHVYHQTGGWAVSVSLATHLLFSVVVFFGMLLVNGKLKVASVGQNPLSIIFKVLFYTIKYRLSHKDEERLIFIDQAHGGPFNDRQFEQAKKSLQILSIILTLVAFQLSGDTYSLGEQLIRERQTCPSLYALLITGVNPNHIPHVIIILVVPVCQLLRCANWKPKLTMLQKILVGLVCSIATVAIEIAIRLMANLTSGDSSNPPGDNLIHNTTRSTQLCFFRRLNENINSTTPLYHVNHAYWWLLLPQTLTGLAYVLVAMVMLEFICTQASTANQGILIGTWYSTNAIKLILGVTDVYITSTRGWYILKAVQLITIILLTLLYTCATYSYEYKEIEETTEFPSNTTHVTTICRVAKVTKGRRKKERSPVRSYNAV